jgi:UPF0755 protein
VTDRPTHTDVPDDQGATGHQPRTRREAREWAAAREQARAQAAPADTEPPREEATASAPEHDHPMSGLHPTIGWAAEQNYTRETPRKRRRWVTWTIVTVVILALFGGGGAYVWFTFQPQVQKLFAVAEPNDYTGNGYGTVDVTIKDGDIGSDVADRLAKAGVVKTSDAFYQLLLKTKPDPVFQPGAYRLKKHMSAEAALALLQNPKSRLTRTLTIPEGTSEKTIIADLAKTTGLSADELKAAAADPQSFGLPAEATSLEGFLFPATYTFDPGVKAHDVLATLVDRAFQALDADGVPAADRWRVVILASIVQREAGSNTDDFGKIARVFQNRLDQGMLLQSDATVAYGTGNTDTVWTTDAEREDAGNPYNTYVHPGLPVGPIGNPGDIAIKAALNPTPGPWLYFVPINLKTGETVFSSTAEEHDAAVQRLHEWCDASPENDAYCQ